MVDARDDYPDPLKKPEKPGPLSKLITGEPQVSTSEDVVKGFGGGLGRGTAGLVGSLGDVSEYGARGIDWATRKVGGIFGVDVKPREAQEPTYGSAAAKRQIESVTGPLYEPKTRAGKYASTIGEFAPAAVIPGGGGIAARAFNTVVPAVASESAGQLTEGSAWEPWARGVAGVTGGLAAAKTVTPTAPASAARRAAVETLDEAGIPMTAGQRTGSRPMQYFESTAADMPFASGRARQMNEAQAAAFDRAVTERVYDRNQLTARGVPADVNLPDPRVARAGRQSLSDEYDRLSANPLRSDPQLIQDLHAAEREYGRNVLPSQQRGDVRAIRDDIVDRLVQGYGNMGGDVYQTTRSRLGKLAESAGTDVALSDAFTDMKRALDRAMQRGLPPAEAEAWALNNTRWGRMKQMENAVATGTENLSPLAVAQGARAGRPGQYAAQRNDLDELARAGALVLKPLPQSGTAPRTFAQNLFNIPNALATGGGLAGSMFGPAGAAVGAAAPFIAARAALSRPGQAYLGNQMLPQRARDILAQTLLQQAISR